MVCFFLYFYFFLGTANITGFGGRLIEELEKLTTNETKLYASIQGDRQYLSFQGATMLLTSADTKEIWLSKEEYYARGPSIVHQKFL